MKGKQMFVGILGVPILAVLLGACSQGVSQETVAAKDQEITALKGQVASLSQDSTYWKELTALMPPVELKSMTDHRAYMLPSGVLLALHFDKPNLQQAQHLNWVALGIPGKNCAEDQERIEASFGKGFTHFHDLMRDTHGSTIPGVEGVWFVHIGVRNFESPMSSAPVKPGVDEGFMPTPAPKCG